MTKWILIEEALPELGFRVLVFCSKIVNIGARHADGDRWVTLYPYEWIFDWQEEKRKKKGESVKVTHWAVLPEGPLRR